MSFLQKPDEDSGTRLFNCLNTIAQGDETRKAAFEAIINKGELLKVRKVMAGKYEALLKNAKALVSEIRESGSLEMRTALLVNLNKWYWGDISRQGNFEAGVPVGSLCKYKEYFKTLCDLRDRMATLNRAWNWLESTNTRGTPCYDRLNDSKLVEASNSEVQDNLLSRSEKIEVLRKRLPEMTGAGKKETGELSVWDTVQHIAVSMKFKKTLMLEAAAGSAGPDIPAKTKKELRNCADAVSKVVAAAAKELSPAARLKLWVELSGGSGFAGYARYGWTEGFKTGKNEEAAMEDTRALLKEQIGRASALRRALIQRKGAFSAGDIHSEAAFQSLSEELEGIWNKADLLKGLLTEDEKAAIFKKCLNNLLPDPESRSSGDLSKSAEDLCSMMGFMSESVKDGRALLKKAMTGAQVQKALAALEGKFRSSAGSATTYPEYIKEVTGRLNRWAEFCGGRDTWGFAHGVDWEDVIDERNASSEFAERERTARAYASKLKALYCMFTYGAPDAPQEGDSFLKGISATYKYS